MQYWLRKNNIEKGPFTKEALLSQGIGASDLIRIDGDSLWQPASEIPALKDGLGGTAKPKYKFTADKQLREIKDTPASRAVEEDKKTETPSSGSPFRRMPSAVPKKKTSSPAPEPTGAQKAVNAKKEVVHPQKQEHPHEPAGPAATSVSHKGAAVPHQVQRIEDAPLKEIKQRPAPKPIRVASKPQNSNFFKEFFLPIIIIGALGTLAWWGFKKFTSPSDSSALSHLDSIKNRQAQMRMGADSPSKGTAAEATAKEIAATQIQPAAKMSQMTQQDSLKTAAAQHLDTSTAALQQAPSPNQADTDATAAREGLTATERTPLPKEEVASIQPQPKKTAETPPAVKAIEPVAPKTATAKPAAKKAPSKISDYVSLSLNKQPEAGIKNMKINVHNSSAEDLNIAVIEVKYYDKAGKFIQGETLQSGKISAGKSTSLKVPASKDAERITYKVSLISGDNVYLMGQ